MNASATPAAPRHGPTPAAPVHAGTAPPAGSRPAAPAGDPLWRWPAQVPLAAATLIADIRMVRALEDGPAAMQQDFRSRALSRLLNHARAVSPWWRHRLTGCDAASAAGGDLSALPVLTRADLVASVEAAAGPLPLPREHGRTREGSTSGSSGVPVRFFVSQFAQRVSDAIYMADHERHGRDTRRMTAAILSKFPDHPGRPHIDVPGEPWLGIGPMRGRSNRSGMREHANWLRDHPPAYLTTAPTVLRGVLDVIAAGECAPPQGVEQIMTVGETVDADLRRDCQALMGASIRDRYTCEELGPLALQCPHDTSADPAYHLCVANVAAEVVDDDGRPVPTGVPGRVLVTGLHHWATPILRYDIGDMAALHPACPCCGATVPTFTALLGRRRFLIRLPSGDRKYLKVTAKDWLKIMPVREHRMVQVSEGRIEVELVLEGVLTPEREAAARAMLAAAIDPSFEFAIRQVDRIAWPRGSKRQDVVSLV